MAFAPLRFLHAADARLDQAIGEIPRLPPRLESIVRDATRAAFDRFIALAIDHEVDFVLLAGNTFVEDDQSLSARLSLLDGLEQLDRSGIASRHLARSARSARRVATNSRPAGQRHSAGSRPQGRRAD